MNVTVVHPSLNRGGGAEKICLSTIKALSREGHNIRLATIDKTDWRFLEDRFGELVKPRREAYLMKDMPIRGMFSQAMFTLSFFPPELVCHKMNNECDIVVNTYGDLIDGVADISYINALPPNIAHAYPEPGVTNSIVWRVIAQAYGVPLKVVDKLFAENVLLANSKFMQGIVRKHVKRNSAVVYPPVDIKKFRRNANTARDVNIVVAVARLRSGKNLELIPRIAKRVKNCEFVIVGLADQAAQDAIKSLTRTTERLGVKNRVKLLVNMPFRKLADTLATAKVFLHTQRTEAFGMSVVEAMAAGCVPVVPRDGGPWLDVLDGRQGEFGFSYENGNEAANIIEKLLENENLRLNVSHKASERATVFDSPAFEKKMIGVVEKVYSRKFE